MSNATKNMAGTVVKEGYEARVALQALGRAGKCPNLHGHVHELMFCDKYNFNPKHILNGEHAQLTKSTTAQMKDVIMTKGGKVIGHAQLKDTSSLSGATKTARQINSGHYAKTRVYGTEETVSRVAGKTSQKVHSSGISSDTTQRISNKALGKMPTASGLGQAAKAGGMAGAAIGASIEAVYSIKDVMDGKKDVSDAVIDIAGAGVKGGVTGAASAAAGSAAAGVTGAAIASVASTTVGASIAATTVGAATVVAAPVVIGFVAAMAVSSVVSSFFD